MPTLSQGFYGRLWRYLDENPAALEALAAQKPRDPVDLVMMLET